MTETKVELKSIRAYFAHEFNNPQYLLDFVGVGHDSTLSVDEGYDDEQIWLIARILEVNHAVLKVQRDLYGWARANADSAVLRRFPISDFSQIRESQLLFCAKEILPRQQSLVTYRMWVDPTSLEHVWLHRETKTEVLLSQSPPSFADDRNWAAPRFRMSAILRRSGDRVHTGSKFTEKILLSPGDLFWICFHKSPLLVQYLLEGATKAVLPRFFQWRPKQIGPMYVCALNRSDSRAFVQAAINLANFQVSGAKTEAYLGKVAQMLVGVLFQNGRAFSEFPLLFPFTEPFMIEFLGRRTLTSEPEGQDDLSEPNDGNLINRQAVQAVQILSIEPRHLATRLHFSSPHKIDKDFGLNDDGRVDVPVTGFFGESLLQKTFTWTPPPDLVLRTEKVGPPLRPARYNRLPKDHPKATLVGNVDTPEDLLRAARLMFEQKVKVPFSRIRPVLGQAPHYEYRFKTFRLLPADTCGGRAIFGTWLGCKIGFPINPTASELLALVQSNSARVWTLADDWYALSEVRPTISLIEIPEWYDTPILVQPHSKRQLCALIARLFVHDAYYYLFSVERRSPPHYNPIHLANFLIKPDEELWLGPNALLDILYTGVRAKMGGWPRTEELVEVAGCYPYPVKKSRKDQHRKGSDILRAINKLDF